MTTITTTFDRDHWQVVPRDLKTALDMYEAGIRARNISNGVIFEIWNAMLAAAPPAPSAWLPPDQAADGEYVLAVVEPDWTENDMVYGSLFFENGKLLVNDYDHYCYPVVCFMRPIPPEQADRKVES